MFKIILTAIILSISVAANADVNYQLYHQNDKIHIVADYGVQSAKIIKLYVPHIIWGTNYDKQIKNLNVQNGTYDSKKSTITLKNFSKNLIIEYDLISVEDCDKTFTDQYYHFFSKEKFYLIGHGAFVYPQNLSDEENISININSNVNEIIINNENKALATRAVNTKLANLYSTLIFGGNKFHRKVYRDDLDIIIWGDDSNSLHHLFDITNKIVKIQKDFWKDRNFKKTIVFIKDPFTNLDHMWGGTNFGNLTLNFVHPNALRDKDFKNFLAHENFHTWFGSNMGFITGLKYFTEGFTDYFTYLINMQNKVISKVDFVRKYNKVLNKYFTSPYRKASEEEIENMFWYGRAQRLSYLKGFIIANELDLKIREISKNQYSLKAIFFAMFKDAKLAKSTLTFSPELLSSYIQKVTGHDLSKELTLILEPDDINLNPKILRNYSLAYQDTIIIDYEFDYTKSMKAVPFRVTGLNHNTFAYKAGLRNGQKFTCLNYSYDKDKSEIAIKLQNKKVIKYIPKMQTVKIPIYK
jgi:predicted metalloprotease with PDZ domain